jgi:hypothetical protein
MRSDTQPALPGRLGGPAFINRLPTSVIERARVTYTTRRRI